MARYRDALPDLVRLPGAAFAMLCHPLPRPVLDRIDLQHTYDTERAAAICAAAYRNPETETPIGSKSDWLNVEPSLLDAAMTTWRRVQEQSQPDIDRLDATLELSCADNQPASLDIISASHAESPWHFFGRPVVELTDGQLSYYFTCRAVYRRVYGSKDNVCRNKSMLQQRAQG